MAQEINSIVDRYLSWIAQLVRALARKARVQVPVQDRIFLFKFYMQPTNDLLLKTKFSILRTVYSYFFYATMCCGLSVKVTVSELLSKTFLKFHWQKTLLIMLCYIIQNITVGVPSSRLGQSMCGFVLDETESGQVFLGVSTVFPCHK